MKDTIILIGPMSAGKSTVATLLSEALNLPQCPLDDKRWEYYDEIGYDKEAAKRIVKTEGMVGLLNYWKHFEAYSVERVLADYADCVIDFGAGQSVYEDETLFQRVENALAPYPNVVLLLPLPDLDESVEILNERFSELLLEHIGQVDEALLAVNEHFVKHHSNHDLAKIVVYTNGKTPKQTCQEILKKLDR